MELVLVIDNDIYKGMNSNLEAVHKYCKDIANIINSVCKIEGRTGQMCLIRFEINFSMNFNSFFSCTLR